MLQSSPPVASGTVEGLDLPAPAPLRIALQAPGEDLESPEFCEMGDQPFGSLQLPRGIDAGSLGFDDHLDFVVHRLENGATLGILGPCQIAGGLFEMHCENDESLLRFDLELDGNDGSPGGLSCRTVGCLAVWTAHCGGSCLVADLGHLARWKGGFQLS